MTNENEFEKKPIICPGCDGKINKRERIAEPEKGIICHAGCRRDVEIQLIEKKKQEVLKEKDRKYNELLEKFEALKQNPLNELSDEKKKLLWGLLWKGCQEYSKDSKHVEFAREMIEQIDKQLSKKSKEAKK